jgi:hypothetical protein
VAERPVALPPERKKRVMPITPFIDGMSFDPETRRVIGVAFEMTCTALHLSDRGDRANEIIGASSSLPRLASAIPICCVKAC